MRSVYSLSQQATATLFNGLAIYNSLEIIVLTFMTFKRYQGVYFYSLLVASIGIVPYGIGNIVHFDGTDNWAWSARICKIKRMEELTRATGSLAECLGGG